MRFLIILKSNLKRMLKSKKYIIANFIIPVVILVGMGFFFNRIGGMENENIIINSDKGSYGQEFINEVEKSAKIKVYEKDKAIEKLKKKNISLCYEIPSDFSEKISKGEKPQLISLKLEKGIEPGNFQLDANSVINKMLIRSEFENNGKKVSLKDLSYEGTHIEVISSGKKKISDTILLNVIISYVLFAAIGISMELFNLKKENILSRSFTTANKPSIIIGGILVALFITTTLFNSTIVTLNTLLNARYMLSKLPITLLNISCLVLVSLSLGIFINRVVKNEKLIPIIIQIVAYITCFVGGSFMPLEFLPKSVTMFSKFTPQYWALQSIDTCNPVLSIVVVLFALALFTAGTFKVRNFAGEV